MQVEARYQGRETAGENRYRLLAENSTDVITVTDVSAVISYVSPSCRTMLGFEPEDLVGRSAYDLIHPEDRESVARTHARLLIDSEPITTPMYRTERADGTHTFVEATVRTIRDDAGRVVEIQAAVRDVSERQLAEGRSIASERQLAEAQRLAGIGSWEWDMRANTVSWSQQLYEISGLDPSEFEPSYNSYLERVHPFDRERVRTTIERSRAGEAHMRYECRIVRPGGEVRTIEARGEVESDDSDGAGEPVTMRGTVQDITERKQAEEQLERMHRELAHRTAELERSNLELEQFAYDASHDLGEPLRILSRLTARLATQYGGELDAEGHALLKSIVDGTERMQMLISDLLEYSRVAGEPMERARVDCAAVFREAVELLEESIAELGASVSAGPLPQIEAHPAQFRQLIQNLLSNALRFGGEESLRITVEAERRGSAWQFSVADNGIGIDPRQAERVFEMFRRLNAGDAYAGTGLGLSICKRIVERHGGEIWVEPRPDGGSVFSFTVPDQEPPLDARLGSSKGVVSS